jgi:hypothetical protein
MSLSGLVLGVINAFIVVGILLLVGALIVWFMSWMGMAVPDMVRKIYIGVVALIGLYMLVAILFGMPHGWRVIGFQGAVTGPAVAAIPARAAGDLQSTVLI